MKVTEQVKTDIDELLNKFSDLYNYDYTCGDITDEGLCVAFYNSPIRRSFSLSISFSCDFNNAEDVMDCVIDAYTNRFHNNFTSQYWI